MKLICVLCQVGVTGWRFFWGSLGCPAGCSKGIWVGLETKRPTMPAVGVIFISCPSTHEGINDGLVARAHPQWSVEAPLAGNCRPGGGVSARYRLRFCPMVCHFCLQACARAMLLLLFVIRWGSVSGCGFPVLPILGLAPNCAPGCSSR